MISRLTLKVLVDDMPSIEGVATAHGLSVLVTLRYGTASRRILFDGGPSGSILSWNSRFMGEEVRPDVTVGSLMHWHHLGALKQLGLLEGALLPPPPLSYGVGGFEIRELPGFPGVSIVLSKTPWPEQALLLETPSGRILLVGCSVHGLRETFGVFLDRLKGLRGIVGGLNVTVRDSLNLAFLKSLARRGVELILPLHSTAWDARRLIMEKYNRFPVEFEVPGVGSQVELE
ncbi:MAG: hypothetical protein QW753_02765 [Thermofilum sp.]